MVIRRQLGQGGGAPGSEVARVTRCPPKRPPGLLPVPEHHYNLDPRRDGQLSAAAGPPLLLLPFPPTHRTLRGSKPSAVQKATPQGPAAGLLPYRPPPDHPPPDPLCPVVQLRYCDHVFPEGLPRPDRPYRDHRSRDLLHPVHLPQTLSGEHLEWIKS